MSEQVGWVADRAMCSVNEMFKLVRAEAQRAVETASLHRKALGGDFTIADDDEHYFEVRRTAPLGDNDKRMFIRRGDGIEVGHRAPSDAGITTDAYAVPDWSETHHSLSCALRVGNDETALRLSV